MRLLSRLRGRPRAGGCKVTVVVPVYNTGPALEELVQSLENQSMPASDFEVVLVDDGSTDGTAERLDTLAQTHDNFVVRHIAHSGWPGTPRNAGLEVARGEFVAFVDHDDYLGPRGLELVHAFAVEHRSDVVIAREVGAGRSIGGFVFRQSIPDARLDEDPVVQLMTPHKLYRRSVLESGGIRFPDGKVRLEDHQFNIRAFFAAERISIYADYAYYYWTRREGVTHASSERFNPHEYFAVAVNNILDVVDQHTEPGVRRDRIKAYWLGKKMLAHLTGRAMLRYSAERREQIFGEVRDLALTRFTPETVNHLEFSMRVREHLVREQRLDRLLALAQAEEGLTASVVAEQAWLEEGAAAVRFSMEFRYRDGSPVLFRRTGDSVVWVPPLDLGPLPRSAVDVTADLQTARLHLLLRRRDAPESHSVCAAGAPRLVPTGEGAFDRLVFSGVTRLRSQELSHLPGAAGPVVVDLSAELDALGRRVTRRVPVPAGGLPARQPASPELCATQLGNLSIRVSAVGADVRAATCSAEAHGVADADPGGWASQP